MNLVTEVVAKQLQLNPNLLYLRGTPEQPADAASRDIVELLRQTCVPFSYVDISANSQVGRAVQALTGTAEFPQFFSGGKYVGGLRAVAELQRTGRLRTLMNTALEHSRIGPGEGPRP